MAWARPASRLDAIDARSKDEGHRFSTFARRWPSPPPTSITRDPGGSSDHANAASDAPSATSDLSAPFSDRPRIRPSKACASRSFLLMKSHADPPCSKEKGASFCWSASETRHQGRTSAGERLLRARLRAKSSDAKA